MLKLSMTEKNALRTQFRMEFDKNEIKEFFYSLELEVDNLEATSRDKLISDLIRHTETKEMLPTLLQMAQESRPNGKFLSCVPSIATHVTPTTETKTTNTQTSTVTPPVTTPEEVPNTPEVFISYAWNTSDSKENERIVNLLEEQLKQEGITIIRDKNDLTYRGNIKKFMERIGRGKYIIVIISDKYLKSKNCMFELLEIFHAGNFAERIFPIVLGDADIYDVIVRLDYIEYWDEKILSLKNAVKEKINKSVNMANLDSIYAEINLYENIRRTIDEMTDTIQNMNTLTPDMHTNEDFKSLYQALQRQIEQDQL